MANCHVDWLSSTCRVQSYSLDVLIYFTWGEGLPLLYQKCLPAEVKTPSFLAEYRLEGRLQSSMPYRTPFQVSGEGA